MGAAPHTTGTQPWGWAARRDASGTYWVPCRRHRGCRRTCGAPPGGFSRGARHDEMTRPKKQHPHGFRVRKQSPAAQGGRSYVCALPAHVPVHTAAVRVRVGPARTAAPRPRDRSRWPPLQQPPQTQRKSSRHTRQKHVPSAGKKVGVRTWVTGMHVRAPKRDAERRTKVEATVAMMM